MNFKTKHEKKLPLNPTTGLRELAKLANFDNDKRAGEID